VDSLLWDIEQEEKEELIRSLRLRYENIDEIKSDTEIPYSNLKQHENGELRSIGLSNVADLIQTVNSSESRFSESSPEDFILKTFDYSEPRVQIPEDLQKTLFRTFDVDTVEELTERSRQTVNRIRVGDSKRIALEDYQRIFEEVNEKLDENFEASGVLKYSGNGDELFEADAEQVVEIQGIRDSLEKIERDEPYKTGRLKHSIDVLDKPPEHDRDLIRPEGKTEGYVYSILEELGLMEKWGGQASPYQILKQPEYFEIVRKELEKDIDKEEETRYSRDELVALLDDYVDRPSKRDIEENSELPSSGTYENVFGSWNNAMWCAGFTPLEQIYSEEELFTQLYELNDSLGRIPTRQEFMKNGATASRNAVENHFGSYEEFAEQAGLYDIGIGAEEALGKYYTSTESETAYASD